jgi:hypothetical protein
MVMRFCLVFLCGCTVPNPALELADSAQASNDLAKTTNQDLGQQPVPLPFGGSSHGAGGPAPVINAAANVDEIKLQLIVPTSYSSQNATPLLMVYSGTEGAKVMGNNLLGAGAAEGIADFICAVLDGVIYSGNGEAGARVLDAMRTKYNIDNDRTYLLGESAGTTAAFSLGFHLRQQFFAAYWANDVDAVDGPALSASDLGFQPWGQVGPGGYPSAGDIVARMRQQDYRLDAVSPYAGAGSAIHGDPQQFLAALKWFGGKTRK